MDVGKMILDIRKNNDLSQEQFGNLFHVTRQTVSNWENEKNYPDLETLVEISHMFHITLDQILKQDAPMVKSIDKERKSAKVRKIIIFILIAVLVFICVGVKILLFDAFKPTPAQKRNISTTSATMYVNLPTSAPSSAIIRTFNRGEYDEYSPAKLAKVRDEIGGNIEGDIPGIALGKNQQIRFIFQDNYNQNVLPDSPPQIVIREYLNVSMLPKDDRVYTQAAQKELGNEGKIREVKDVLTKDSDGYFCTFDHSLEYDSSYGSAEDYNVTICLIEVYYSIEGQEYVSTTALSVGYPQ